MRLAAAASYSSWSQAVAMSRPISDHQHAVSQCGMTACPNGCRLGRGSTPPGVADDYKSAALLSRAEEGDSSVLHPQRVHSRARPVMRDADSKNWGPTDRPDDAIPAKQAGGADSEYEGLV